MSWQPLNDPAQLEAIRAASHTRPQLIFKHSTRCAISKMALHRMDGSLDELANRVGLHFIDLLNYRAVSNTVAEQLQVHHESPQALLIVQGECVQDWSHQDIRPADILAALPAQT